MQPEMSALEVTEKLLKALKSQKYDMVICNYANPDMVGHTGVFDAAVKAVETVDACLGRVIATLREIGGEVVIIADHGNAEKMIDLETGAPHTAHTTNLVPFVYMGRSAVVTKEVGELIDVAPTLLYLMGIEEPKEMTGESMVKLK
jgi:2,3-bisphosphoglycerate-independent phosphoglycerate mutase